MINVGSQYSTSRRAVALAKKYQKVFNCSGSSGWDRLSLFGAVTNGREKL